MALFLTIDQIRTYIPVNASFTFADISPLIADVETEFIKDILGTTEYTNLNDAFNANTLSSNQTLLLPYCQRAIAWLAYMRWVPIGNIQVIAGGFRVVASDNTLPASQWRVKDFEHECAKNGFNALEKLLIYLWSVATGTYTGWDASAERTNHRNLLLLSAKEFQQSVDINNSYEIFRKLKSYILFAELNHVKPITGAAQYDQLKANVLANSITANNEILMAFIRPCLANYAMANGALRLSFVLQAYGIIQNRKGDKDNINVEDPVKDNLLSAFMHECKRNGQLYEDQLREYLKANAATYPLYEASDAFEDLDDDDEDGDNVNDADSGFFAFGV